MEARDAMTELVVTVKPQTSVEEVAGLMLKHRISAVPVVDGEGRVQGIVSEGDLIRRAESGTEQQRSWWLDLITGSDARAIDYAKAYGRTAEDVMTRSVITVSERTPLVKIVKLLERHRIKRVPVVRRGKLVGIVSRANLLHGLGAQRTASGPVVVADRKIRAQLNKELERAGIDRWHVNIVVTKGVVELWGFVETVVQKRALAIAVGNVKGVRRVVNNATVLTPMLQAA